MLTERRANILRFIVDEYVDSAQPVGSERVAHKYALAVSSATVRNEMMRLEEEGYLSHPHTSAGRVPSDKGYRYYVEALMEEEELPQHLRRNIRRRFQQAAGELEEWARLAAATLATYLSNAALVSSPRSGRARLRWLEAVGVHDLLVLLIVVLQEAWVRQQAISLSRSLGQDELTNLARKLSTLFGGMTADEIGQRSEELTALEGEVMQAVAGLLEAEDARTYEPAALEGLRNMLRQPEFPDRQSVIDVMDLLSSRNLFEVVPLQELARGDVAVIIGHEHAEGALHRCSVVVTRYGTPSGLSGALGVVGPTRLDYPRAVGMVRFMSSLISELMTDHFG